MKKNQGNKPGEFTFPLAEHEKEELALEPLLNTYIMVPTPVEARVVTVVGDVGGCPRGRKVSDVINVDEEGHISKALCRAAIEALTPLLKPDSDAKNTYGQVSCICPLAGRHLMFDVRPAEDAHSNTS